MTSTKPGTLVSLWHNGSAFTPEHGFIPQLQPDLEQVIRFPLLTGHAAECIDLSIIWGAEIMPQWFTGKAMIYLNGYMVIATWQPVMIYLGDNKIPYGSPLLGTQPDPKLSGMWLAVFRRADALVTEDDRSCKACDDDGVTL